MTDDHERFQHTLDKILAQTQATNGRVNRLWLEVFGDPNASGRDGLVQQARDTQAMVREWRQVKESFDRLVTVTRWLIGIVLTVVAPLLVWWLTIGHV